MRSTRLLRNTIANYAGRFLAMGINFLLVPFLVHSLGDTGYGIWQLTGSVIAYFFLLDLGISTSVARYVAKHDAEGLQERVNQIVSTLFFIYCALGVAALLLAGGLAPFFPRLFHVEASLVSTAQVVFFLAGLNFALVLPTSIFNAILVGYQRIDLNNLAAAVAQIVQALLVVVLLSRGFGLVALALVAIAQTMMLAALRLWFIRRTEPQLKMGRHHVRRGVLRSVMGFSMVVFAMQINQVVLNSADKLIIGSFLGAATVTPFAIAHKLGNILWQIAVPLSVVLFPAFAELEGLRDPHRARGLLLAGTKISAGVVLPLAALLLLLGTTILDLWVGPAYTSVKPTLDLLVLYFMALAISRPAWQLLFGFGEVRRFFFILSSATVLNLLLGVLLVGRYGIWGVALSTVLPMSIAYIAFLLPQACRVVDLPAKELFVNGLLRPALALIPPVLLLGGLLQVVYPGNIVMLAAEAGAFMFVYLFSYVTMAMTGKERRGYWQVCRDLPARLRIGQSAELHEASDPVE